MKKRMTRKEALKETERVREGAAGLDEVNQRVRRDLERRVSDQADTITRLNQHVARITTEREEFFQLYMAEATRTLNALRRNDKVRNLIKEAWELGELWIDSLPEDTPPETPDPAAASQFTAAQNDEAEVIFSAPPGALDALKTINQEAAAPLQVNRSKEFKDYAGRSEHVALTYQPINEVIKTCTKCGERLIQGNLYGIMVWLHIELKNHQGVPFSDYVNNPPM